jgi:NAD(P)-dependent dehydrogenase (short-subunit alcohol dehydrogenase family)
LHEQVIERGDHLLEQVIEETGMDMGLEGARVFVSGSTQGIGFAIAEALLQEGAAVVVNGRSQVKVDDAVARLAHSVKKGDASGIAADFADADQVDALLERLGDVDVLVNNVGLFEQRAFVDIADADWARFIQVNLMSGVRLSRALLPGMLARGRGRVIFVSSESGVDVPAEMIHYGATKAAMLGLANGLAKLTRGTAVTVNSILGGPTYSDGVAGTIAAIAASQALEPEALKAAIIAENRTSLLERFIEPREIAELAVYLASPRSSATNGAALRADGGVLTGIL